MSSTFTPVTSSAQFKPSFFPKFIKDYSYHCNDVSDIYILSSLQLLTALLRPLLLFKMTVCIRRTRNGILQILCRWCLRLRFERTTTVFLHSAKTKFKSWSQHLQTMIFNENQTFWQSTNIRKFINILIIRRFDITILFYICANYSYHCKRL